MEGLGAKWAEGIEPVPEREIGAVTEMDQEVEKRWLVEAGQAAQSSISTTYEDHKEAVHRGFEEQIEVAEIKIQRETE